MLHTLFPKNYRRYERSNCAEELEAFGAWLMEAGYSRENTCGHLHRLRSVLEGDGEAVAAARYSGRRLAELFSLRDARPGRVRDYRATRRVYQRFLASQDRFDSDATAGPWERRLEDYAEFLREVRGFAPTTIAKHLSHGVGLPEPRTRSDTPPRRAERGPRRAPPVDEGGPRDAAESAAHGRAPACLSALRVRAPLDSRMPRHDRHAPGVPRRAAAAGDTVAARAGIAEVDRSIRQGGLARLRDLAPHGPLRSAALGDRGTRGRFRSTSRPGRCASSSGRPHPNCCCRWPTRPSVCCAATCSAGDRTATAPSCSSACAVPPAL